MKLLLTNDITIRTKQGTQTLLKGQIITVPDEKADILIEKDKAKPLEPITVKDWLKRLSDSERELFEERAAIIMVFDGGIEREQAEIEAIKLIIKERIIPGKCDKCERVKLVCLQPNIDHIVRLYREKTNTFKSNQT